MNDCLQSFIEIVKYVTPYVVYWGLGTKAFKFITGTLLGKDVGI